MTCKINYKIYPEEKLKEKLKENDQTVITNYICQQYIKAKPVGLFKIFNGFKKIILNKNTYSIDPYYDPKFIVLENLTKEQIIKQIDIFVNNNKNSFVFLDIAKYIRKHWSDFDIKHFVDEIIEQLKDIQNSKYWFYQFYPLIESGEQLILELINNKKIEGFQTELLYGIYLMEPKRLNQFYPVFLLAVEKSSNFNLWSRSGSYFENYKIIDKLYANGYNIFTNQLLENFWLNPVNNYFFKQIKMII